MPRRDDIERIPLSAENRGFSPPWSFALGLALGFYALGLPRLAILALSVSVSAFGLVLAAFHAPRPRLHAILVLALGLGLASAFILRGEEEGRLPPQDVAAQEKTRGAAIQGLPGDAIQRTRGDAIQDLRVTGLEGRLEADSSPLRKGFRSYSIEADALVLEAPGVKARVGAQGSFRALLRGGPALETGSSLAIEGGSLDPGPSPGEEGILFAEGKRLAASPPRGVAGRLRHVLRSAFLAALDRAGGGGASSGLLVALLSGCRDELDQAESDDFRKAGCAAVLSLSGQHLSILAAAIALVLKPLGGPIRARKAALALCLAFVFVAGFEPALLRSLIMYGIGSIAILIDRPQQGRTILGLSFALQTVIDPGSARGLSFELSYLALAGLVVLAPRFEYAFRPWTPPPLASALAASFAAQAATTPLAAACFGSAYPVGILSSIVTGPIVAAFIWWGLAAALLCGPLPFLAPILSPVTVLLHGLLAGAMAFFAKAPALTLNALGVGLLSCGVVLGAAFVYALPYAEHLHGRRKPHPEPRGLAGRASARLRLARGPS